jgi:hypothetical protein
MEENVDLRPAFLVERYLPGLTQDTLTALAARLDSAAGEIHRSGTPVSWLGSTALLEEETMFCVFRAPSREAVQALNELALAPYERMSEVFFVDGEPSCRSH